MVPSHLLPLTPSGLWGHGVTWGPGSKEGRSSAAHGIVHVRTIDQLPLSSYKAPFKQGLSDALKFNPPWIFSLADDHQADHITDIIYSDEPFERDLPGIFVYPTTAMWAPKG